MYPVSMSDYPGPGRGVFFIAIVDTISKRSLLLLSLLHASNYNYNKGPLKVEFINFKTKHSVLFLIAVLQSISLR